MTADDGGPWPVPLTERIRSLPGAVLLALGYYASRAPWQKSWRLPDGRADLKAD